MNKDHARRSAALVKTGERPGGPGVEKALRKQSRTPKHLTA
jgi:hypothetical protein